MKFYMFCKVDLINGEAYDTYLGITAKDSKEAKARLIDLVGDKWKQFQLFDVADEVNYMEDSTNG